MTETVVCEMCERAIPKAQAALKERAGWTVGEDEEPIVTGWVCADLLTCQRNRGLTT